MRPRILILAREQVLHWAPLYMGAFRRQADVITAGPPLDSSVLEKDGVSRAAAYRVPNDLVLETDDVCGVVAALPPGWTPDAVVVIQTTAPAWRNLPRLAVPTAHISVDTWHRPEEYADARACDLVYVAQRGFVPGMRAAGSRRAQWLPLAADPWTHHPISAAPQYDFAFVGSLRYVVNEQRITRINRLTPHFTVATLDGADAAAMRGAYALGRLAFNSSVAQDVNMRVFEALAMGRCLFTNRDAAAHGLFEIFEDGRHLATYDDADLVSSARRWLDDAGARDLIARTGRDEVLARHTYDHRVATILGDLAALPRAGGGEPLRTGNGPSAWLPLGARRVADLGLVLDRARPYWRQRGVESMLGVTWQPDAAVRRRGSYDAMHLWPLPAADCDAVVTHAGQTGAPPLSARLAWAHAALPDGGTLVMVGNSRTEHGNSDPLAPYGFATVLSDEAAEIRVARRHSRSHHDLAAEMYANFPGGQLRPDGGLSAR